MSTFSPHSHRDDLLELVLQARREPLPPAEAERLKAALEEDPKLRTEVRELEAFLDQLTHSRVPLRPEFQERLRARLTEVAHERRVARTTAERGPLRSSPWWRRWAGSRDEAPRRISLGTLMLGRVVAVYLGIASGVLLFLLWRTPASAYGIVDPSVHVAFRERAASDTSAPGFPTELPRTSGRG